MKLPSHFMILGQKLPVKEAESGELAEGDLGEYKSKRIYIKKGEGMATLIHEFVHAHCDRSGITQALDDGTEEILCSTLELTLLENFDVKIKDKLYSKKKAGNAVNTPGLNIQKKKSRVLYHRRELNYYYRGSLLPS